MARTWGMPQLSRIMVTRAASVRQRAISGLGEAPAGAVASRAKGMSEARARRRGLAMRGV